MRTPVHFCFALVSSLVLAACVMTGNPAEEDGVASPGAEVGESVEDGEGAEAAAAINRPSDAVCRQEYEDCKKQADVDYEACKKIYPLQQCVDQRIADKNACGVDFCNCRLAVGYYSGPNDPLYANCLSYYPNIYGPQN